MPLHKYSHVKNCHDLNLNKKAVNPDLNLILDKYCESYGFSYENIYLCVVSCCSNIVCANKSKKFTLTNKELTVDSFLLKSILVGLTNTKKSLCIDLANDCLLKAESTNLKVFNDASIENVNNMDETLLESSLTHFDDLVSNEKSLKSTGFLSDFILVCPRPNRVHLNKLKPFKNDIDLTKIFFTLKILVNKNDNTSFILDMDALKSVNSFSENLNNDFDKYEIIDHNFNQIFGKTLDILLKLIGTLHIIDNLFDIIKKIPNYKNISFEDLFDWLNSNSNLIQFKKEIKKIACDKYIIINNYFLLNKIYLTKYDPESLNDEIKEDEHDEQIIHQRDIKTADKSTDTIELKEEITPITRDIKSSSQDKSTDTIELKEEIASIKKEANNKLPSESSNLEEDAAASVSALTLRTIDSFISSSSSKLLADRTFLDRSINIIETPPSLLELLFLEQVRKHNMLKKES